MFENENTAQTTVTEDTGAATNAVGGEENTGEVSDTTFSDGDESGEGSEIGKTDGEGGTDAEEKARQKAINSENARRRRESERREADRQRDIESAKTEARNKAILDVLGGVNPYTKEPMKDARDVEEYLTMKEIEKSGRDPVADFAKYQKEKEREKESAAAAEAQRRAWYRDDQAKFEAAHPDVKISELIKNKTFLSVAAGKVGKVPLNDIYAEYVETKNSIINEYKQESAKAAANKKASPGALGGEGGTDTRFTLEQMQGMSRSEVKKNWAAIQESLKHI